MDVLLACLHGAAYATLAFALPMPRARRLAMACLLLAAVASVATGASTSGERTLTTVHTYAGYEGAAQEVSMVSFPTGTVSAPGWQWPLPFAAFAGAWVLVLWFLRQRQPKNPLVLPMLFAWSATAAWLAMQQLAAPGAIVQPIGLDRFLYPAGLALALLAARSARSLLVLFVLLSGSTIAARLPAALFSKYASDHQLGTCLDIHTVRAIVNPMTQLQFDPLLQPGSGEQQFWLIWLEHVIIFPAIYCLSLIGIAFGVYMFHHHGAPPDGAAAS
ncbi:MAG TPA: hypothetical protein VFZ65_19830 [Planctomycetota bacterium]|nr:hypothetical protein [Planctomycetota bacterium]